MLAQDLGFRIALEAVGTRIPATDVSLGIEHIDCVVGDGIDQQPDSARPAHRSGAWSRLHSSSFPSLDGLAVNSARNLGRSTQTTSPAPRLSHGPLIQARRFGVHGLPRRNPPPHHWPRPEPGDSKKSPGRRAEGSFLAGFILWIFAIVLCRWWTAASRGGRRRDISVSAKALRSNFFGVAR